MGPTERGGKFGEDGTQRELPGQCHG